MSAYLEDKEVTFQRGRKRKSINAEPVCFGSFMRGQGFKANLLIPWKVFGGEFSVLSETERQRQMEIDKHM